MTGEPRWTAGEQIVYREVLRGRAWTGRPVTVIADTPEVVALCLQQGTRWQRCTPLEPEGDLVCCKAGLEPWGLVETVYAFELTVLLIYGGDAHATHVMWNAGHEFIGWYVNLQEPLRRTRLGFDFLDQELDMVIQPNGDWRWKDEEHLAEAEQWGVFSPAQCAAIRAEAQRVIAKIEARAAPFDGAWSDWHMPSDWPPPSLPAGWEGVP
jgi:hypothetical protein